MIGGLGTFIGVLVYGVESLSVSISFNRSSADSMMSFS
jgi:hypothetical protein